MGVKLDLVLVLRKIFGPKREEVMGELRKLLNEESRDLYPSPSIIRGTLIDYWWESQRER
jgi:hypothetical protein